MVSYEARIERQREVFLATGAIKIKTLLVCRVVASVAWILNAVCMSRHVPFLRLHNPAENSVKTLVNALILFTCVSDYKGKGSA